MYLGRHVVSASLEKLETCGNLSSVFESLENIPTSNPNDNCFDDFVFVLEEIDTGSDLCMSDVSSYPFRGRSSHNGD